MTKSFFLWKAEYSVGVIEIDNQHKRIIEILNLLYEAFMKNEHQQHLGKILDELEDYTKIHFKTEETYFRKFNYEKSVEHIKEHTNFIKKLNFFREETIKNKTALTYSIINFLREWLTNHIMVEDKKYTTVFKINGLL